MATSALQRVIGRLRTAALRDGGPGLTDGQLLGHFIERRDEAAVAALVRRHGPMVWGVCRRVLGDHHDAEDAFQATFLVLVRKAAAVLPRERVANWLYGVAHHTALKARAAAARRRARERQVTAMVEPGKVQVDTRDDLQPLLDQELSRLPEKYRTPLVLCYLEGKTHKEAARQLGWPVGTLAGRLARARALLARRLGRRGLAVSGGALAAVLAQDAAAGVPGTVAAATVKAASLYAAGTAAGLVSAEVIALTEGVLKAMLLTKLKITTTVVLAFALTAAGAGVLGQATRAAGQGDGPADALTARSSESVRKDAGANWTDRDRLQGTWHIVTYKLAGRDIGDREFIQKTRLTVRGDRITITPPDKVPHEAEFRLDALSNPKEIDLRPLGGPVEDKIIPGIYRFEGDAWAYCYSGPDKKRPTSFGSTDDEVSLVVFKRVPESPEKVRKRPDLLRPADAVDSPPAVAGASPPGEAGKRSAEVEQIQGTWRLESYQHLGTEHANLDSFRSVRIVIEGEKFKILRQGNPSHELGFRLDPAKNPKEIYLRPLNGPEKEKIIPGIYRLEADALAVCYTLPGMKPPANFGSTGENDPRALLVLKRENYRKQPDPLWPEVKPAKPTPGTVQRLTDGLGERARRVQRWKLALNTQDGGEFVKQLQVLGGFIAFPDSQGGQYRVVRNLDKRPVTAEAEDLKQVKNIFWVESDRRAVAAIAGALGLKGAPEHFVVFFPRYVEDELRRKEKARGSREGQNEPTVFKLIETTDGFELRVAE